MLGLCLLASCLYLYVKAGLFSVDEVLTFVEYNDTDGALDPVTEEDKQLCAFMHLHAQQAAHKRALSHAYAMVI